MQAAVIFDSREELEKRIPTSFIAQEWTNRSSWGELYISERVRIEQAGFTEEDLKQLIPLINKAKRWEFQTGTPHNTSMSVTELLQWEKLAIITSLKANI